MDFNERRLVIHDRLEDPYIHLTLLNSVSSRQLKKYLEKGKVPKSNKLRNELIEKLYLVERKKGDKYDYQMELFSPSK